MKFTTKNLTILAMLTALYVVLSAFLKFTLVGNIMVDLGYIAFAYALCMFGVYGTVVGVVGCALESILFSAYGFSISWALANLAIGLIAGFALNKDSRTFYIFGKCVIAVFAVAIGMLVVKTAVECILYSIPLVVKLPKNAVAFAVDSVTMIVGIFFYEATNKKIKI